VKNIPNLLIKCPECKAIVDTGVSMNLSIFCVSKLVNNAAVCTEHTCKAKINWGKEDVLAISFCQAK
jgi:hypothetical protein